MSCCDDIIDPMAKRQETKNNSPKRRRRRRRQYHRCGFCKGVTWRTRLQQCLIFFATTILQLRLELIMTTTAFSTSTLSSSSSPSSSSSSNVGWDSHSTNSVYDHYMKYKRTPPRSTSTSLSLAKTFGSQGLSPYFQAILSRTNERQRFVTGKFPLIVTIKDDPTRKWLNLGRKQDMPTATSYVLVNDTTIDKSLASYDRFQWLDEHERCVLHERYTSVSMELLAEIHMIRPGYLQILSSDGAGSSAAALRNIDAATNKKWKYGWNSNQNRAVFQELEDLCWEAPFRDRLWVTGFSLAGRKGIVKSMDVQTGEITSINSRSEAMTLWPNEVNAVPSRLVSPAPPSHSLENDDGDLHQHHTSSTSTKTTTKTATTTTTTNTKRESVDDALLVSDGFLVPGKDRGGIYVIKNPGNPESEWTICLTNNKLSNKDPWFYHRAVWVDLTGDGRKSILTARAKLRKVIMDGSSSSSSSSSSPFSTSAGSSDVTSATSRNGRNNNNNNSNNNGHGQLVWLEMPKPHHYDKATGTPLEDDGTVFDPFHARHLPWKERVLATGPDVMFNVADIDPDDDTIEVIASQFFNRKVSLHSIQIGIPRPKVIFSRIIDHRCGSAFGSILTNLDGHNNNIIDDIDDDIDDDDNNEQERSKTTTTTRRRKKRKGRRNVVIDTGSTVPSIRPGDTFSHVLVTSHECNYYPTSSSSPSSSTTTASIDSSDIGNVISSSYSSKIASNPSSSSSSSSSSSTAAPATTTMNGHVNGKSTSTATTTTGIHHYEISGIGSSIGNSEDVVDDSTTIKGGSLFAYRIPTGTNGWKTKPWIRTTVATGFRVKSQLWNMINPGAPGFVYTFFPKKSDKYIVGQRPMIAIAGDCAESAYIFRPDNEEDDDDDDDDDDGGRKGQEYDNNNNNNNNEDISNLSSSTTSSTAAAAAADHEKKKTTLSSLTMKTNHHGLYHHHRHHHYHVDHQARYKLMCEIQCSATVGSIGIGYEDLCSAEQESGYAKIYIPCYEKDKIMVFALGSGEDAEDDDGW